MIQDYWSPKPQSFYVPDFKKPISMSHISVGLGDSDIITSTMLWDLVSVTSRLPFVWEDESVPRGKCPSSFDTLKQAKADLGRANEFLLGPFHDFYKWAMSADLSKWQLTKFYGDQAKLKFVIRARYVAKFGPQSGEDEAVLDIAKRKIWSGA